MKIRARIQTWLAAHPRAAEGARKFNKRRRTWITLFVMLCHIAGFFTSVDAIMSVRTAQGAIAWLVSLNTVPYVAVPAYWVFGRSEFNGYVLTRRADLAEVAPETSKFIKTLSEQRLIALPDRDRPLLVERLAKLPFTLGNDAELLVDGEATFKSIFEGIARAKSYVLVQFYIIRDDSVGRELKASLLERAKAGVSCRLLYDEIGSKLPATYIDELRRAGVDVRPFHSTRGDSNRFQLNFRNHRKVVIVDGIEAWVGGLNVGDEYKSLNTKFGYWRDTHMRVVGPVVQCTQVAFVEDWHWATDETPQNLNWNPQPAPKGASRALLCLPSGPADRLETCTLFFLNAINSAKTRLWIASPYFVPDEQFISALQLAALRGVDVRIIIPEEADNPLVQLAAWAYFDVLDRVGIKVYRYTKGFMHHKVMLVDDEYGTIGTANFDNRSFRLNFEITMAFANRDFADQVAKMLETDMTHCRAVRTGELQEHGYWFRFMVRAANLTAPVL